VKRAYGLEPLVRVIDAEGQRVHRALLVYLPLVSIPHGSTHQRVPKIIPIVAPEDDSIWDVMVATLLDHAGTSLPAVCPPVPYAC
jgi:hypothetical protein